MRNVPLFNALVRAFGDAKVSKEGDAILLRSPAPTVAQSKLRRHERVRPEVLDGGEQYHVCCPFCGDKRYRLYISHAWDRTVRDTEGKLVYAGKRAICFNEKCLDDKDNFEWLERTIAGAIIDADSSPLECDTSIEDIMARRIPLPAGFERLSGTASTEAVGYLETRGFDFNELENGWGVGSAQIPVYSKRSIVFPIYQNSELVGWQARCPSDDPADYGKTKYYWPSGTKKSWWLYNMDRARLERSVVVVEGVLDAIRVGPNAVAIWGKDASARQLAMLSEFWRNGSLFWLPDMEDPSSVECAVKRVAEFNARGAFKDGAVMVELPAGDPGACSRELIWKEIKASAVGLRR